MRTTTTWVTILVLGLAIAAAAGISACGKKAEEVANDTDRDNFMSAEEAKAYGLVDEVLKPGSETKESGK